jgi:hypothetical protein
MARDGRAGCRFNGLVATTHPEPMMSHLIQSLERPFTVTGAHGNLWASLRAGIVAAMLAAWRSECRRAERADRYVPYC